MTEQSAKQIAPDRTILIEMYRIVTLIKGNDDRFIKMIKEGKFATPYYSPRGQEIIPAAISVNLTPQDYVVTIYRGIHDQLAKGIPLKKFWAEFAGKATGTCKGKGGPMHITHPETGIMVTTGIVGAGLPIATGLALASQIKGDGRVTVCNFGDGASNIGAFHESLNLASVWKLPVLFVCQNNRYGEHTKYENSTAVGSIADRAAAYNMRGVSVDGNDPLAMWRAAQEAVAYARAGHGPTLIEARTFRFRGHLLGDDSHYIPKEEMAAALARDPLPAFKAMLLAEGHATEAELDLIASAIERDIDEAAQFALDSPYPDLSELTTDIFAAEVSA